MLTLMTTDNQQNKLKNEVTKTEGWLVGWYLRAASAQKGYLAPL